MEKSQKILIMLIGKTHTGKTTFAKELEEKAQDLIVLEADPVAIFMKEQFPKLRENDDSEHNGLFNNVALKFRTFLLFVEFALSLGRPVILSNSNMWIKGRELVFGLCKKFNYKVIGIYFDFPEEFLLQRVKKSERSINILRLSKDFEDLIVKQRTRMQPPDASQFDEFFSVKSEEGLEEIKNKLLKNL